MDAGFIQVGYQDYVKRVHDYRQVEMKNALAILQSLLTKGDEFLRWTDEENDNCAEPYSIHVHFDKGEIHYAKASTPYEQYHVYTANDIPFYEYEPVYRLVRQALSHFITLKGERFDQAQQLVESL